MMRECGMDPGAERSARTRNLLYRLTRTSALNLVGPQRSKSIKSRLDRRARQRRSKKELARWISRHDASRIARACVYGRFPRGDPFWVELPHLGIDLPLRPRTADALDVFDSLVVRSHLPPHDLRPTTIVDAGLCTGITLYDFADLYPNARIIGIEPQPYYAQLCRQISARYGDRVRVLEASLAPVDGKDAILYVPDGEEYAASAERRDGCSELVVRTLSLNSLVGQIGTIDFVKLDIEGAERDVFEQNVEWAHQTRCVKVELHGDYTVAECTTDLECLGFACEQEPRHWACVVGRRT